MDIVTTWYEYVTDVLPGEANQTRLAGVIGVDQSTVNRWATGRSTPPAADVIEFARKYKGNVLAALVAAGHLTADEANARPLGSLKDVSTRRLLNEIQRRADGKNDLRPL